MLAGLHNASQREWEAAGHAQAIDWLGLLGRIGALLLLATYAALLLRAFLRRHRYRAMEMLSDADLTAIHAELAAAEKKTVGEIVPIVLERSDRHPGASWLAALAFLLLGSAVLAPILWEKPLFLLAAQLACGVLGFATATWLPDFKRLFVTEARATEMAEEQAFQEFYRLGLHETVARTGVLLFVSLLERRAIVLGDKGIDEKVGEDHWKATDEAILKGVAAGSLRDGLIGGIRSAGAVLAEHFPWKEGDRNEVPDRLIVRKE